MSIIENKKETSLHIGLAVTLVFLISAYAGESSRWLPFAIFSLVLTMALPSAWTVLTPIWNILLWVLELVVSRIVLLAVFFVVLTPIGMVRRAFGADSLRLREWKKGKDSVFTERGHVWISDDLQYPY